MKFLIVVMLYQFVVYIDEFYWRVSVVVWYLVGEDYEIVFVNDGLFDMSLEWVIWLVESDVYVVVVDLLCNFGYYKVMMIGLVYVKGVCIFLIDSDFEEEFEWLLNFDVQMSWEGCDVVYGVQEF